MGLLPHFLTNSVSARDHYLMLSSFLTFETGKLYFYSLVFSLMIGSILLPLVNKFMREIISPYNKANKFKRVFASSIDIFLCILFCYPAIDGGSYFLTFGASYLLFKDAIWEGRSLGKALLGLLVIRLKDGKPCNISQSVLRNAIFIFPGINIVGFVFELMLVFKDNKGIRLGDKFARTQVVEGKKVPELVKWMEIILSHSRSMAETELPPKEVVS